MKISRVYKVAKLKTLKRILNHCLYPVALKNLECQLGRVEQEWLSFLYLFKNEMQGG